MELEDFASFSKRFAVKTTAPKVKGITKVFLNKHKNLIESLVTKGYTDRMIFLTLTQDDPSIDINFNTTRSWIQKNIKKGKIKAFKVECKSEISSGDQDVLIEPHTTNFMTKQSNQDLKSQTKGQIQSLGTQIPRPQLPLKPADKQLLMDTYGVEVDDFYFDCNGVLFDGYSAESDVDLAPIPKQFQILAQQEGLRKHYFLFRNQTIDSSNLISFIKEKISSGTLHFTY